jgi:ABC-type lipoprotein export system ATPase subunit
MIRLEGVGKSYQAGDAEVRALHGGSLTVDEGDFVAIMGPSGPGKSTMMNTWAASTSRPRAATCSTGSTCAG